MCFIFFYLPHGTQNEQKQKGRFRPTLKKLVRFGILLLRWLPFWVVEPESRGRSLNKRLECIISAFIRLRGGKSVKTPRLRPRAPKERPESAPRAPKECHRAPQELPPARRSKQRISNVRVRAKTGGQGHHFGTILAPIWHNFGIIWQLYLVATTLRASPTLNLPAGVAAKRGRRTQRSAQQREQRIFNSFLLFVY